LFYNGGAVKKELNTVARDSLVHQTSELMQDLNDRKRDIERSLQYLEEARNSSYTAPMAEVRTILKVASDRIAFDLCKRKTAIRNLAEVANQIKGSEE
jgi:hypothetical protein